MALFAEGGPGDGPSVRRPGREVVNSKGYTAKNIRLSCLFCNYARGACKPKRWKNIMKILRGKSHVIDFTKYEPRRKADKLVQQKEPCDLDCGWLLQKLKDINFRCELTTLPLFITKKHHFPLSVSVDRIKQKVGHLKENCQLTCRFINLGKNRMSNEKFKHWFAKRFAKMRIDKVIYPKDYKKNFFANRRCI